MFSWGLLAGIALAAILALAVRYVRKRLFGELTSVPDTIYPYIMKGVEKLVAREGEKTTYRILGYNSRKKKASVLIYPQGFGHPTPYYVTEYGGVYAVGHLAVRTSELEDVKGLIKEFHGVVVALGLSEVLTAHLTGTYSIGDHEVKRSGHGNIFQFSAKAQQGGATNLYEVDIEKRTVSLLAVTWSFHHGEVEAALGRT